MESLKTSTDTLFILVGAILVLAMHAGFAFLELGTVRKKNQVNALVKILADFAVSTIAYFFIGYAIAYGTGFFGNAAALSHKSGYELVRFFFLLTFAAAIPAIVSGGIAERAKFNPQLAATFLLVGFVYPPNSTISRAASSCMRSVAGSGLPQCCCSAPGAGATPRKAASPRTRRHRSRFSRWGRGC
jgi:ammonia channel protein AmtB